MALTFDKVTKIITIQSPDTEITIQNLLNSIRAWEDELTSLDIPFIASCAGKEPLGGGVSVGLTLTLLDDWQLAFEARLGPDYIQCKVSGGNIVATHVNGSIYPTAFTQVLITASSSATQANISAIEFSSFNGGVFVDTGSSHSGTDYPIGTPQEPVNNMVDALLIAESRGFTTFYIFGDITLDDSLSFVQYTFIGESIVKTEITVEGNADVTKCEFYECTLTGVLDGECKIKNCLAKNINYISGYIELCLIEGILSIGGGAIAYFMDCWAGQAVAEDPPIIDMGGAGQKLVLQNFNGRLKIQNMTGVNDLVGITLNAGWISLASSITNGNVNVLGTGHVDDETTGNASVDTSKLITAELFADIQLVVDRVLTATEIRESKINDVSATTTKFITTLNESTNNFWDRASILFTSGQNKGLIRAIKNYAGGTKEITIQTPLSFQPANDDTFIICMGRKFLTPDILELTDAMQNYVVEGTMTDVEMKRIIFSALAGLCSGGDTTNITFKDLLNIKNRIDVIVDNKGNRSSIILDGS